MAYLTQALRRFLVKEGKPLAALYSTAAKNVGPVHGAPGKEFREMFSGRRIKRNWELAPLFIIMSGAAVGLCGYIIYAFQTRDDVRVFRKANYETTDLLNPKSRKMITFNQKYPAMREAAEAYKAMEEVEKNE